MVAMQKKLRVKNTNVYYLNDDRMILLKEGEVLTLRELQDHYCIAYSPSGQYVWIDKDSCEML